MGGRGLIGTERGVLDGVHLWAKVPRQSWGPAPQGAGVLVEALAAVGPARATALRAEFVPPAGEAEPGNGRAFARESERTAALVAAVADQNEAARPGLGAHRHGCRRPGE